MLSCSSCDVRAPAKAAGTWDLFSNEENVSKLNHGTTLIHHACRSKTALQPREQELAHLVLGLSSFEDEQRDNNVPMIDIRNPSEAQKFTTVITKVSYLLPGVRHEAFTPEVVSSPEYITACVPGNVRVWPQVTKNTFRITKTIIPVIFSVTIQFRASVIPVEILPSLSLIDRIPVHYAVLLERTKRDPSILDATAKCKCVLAFTEVDGGLFVTNLTVVLNSALPSFASKVFGMLGSLMIAEGGETALRTRKYMAERSKQDQNGHQDNANGVIRRLCYEPHPLLTGPTSPVAALDTTN